MPPYLAFHNSNQVVGLAKFEHIPTLTLQDILEMLPKRIEMPTWEGYYLQIQAVTWDNRWRVGYPGVHYEEGFLIEAAFDMLKWCKQNIFLNEKTITE